MIRLAAPAKINLGLRVMRRREDGYHELESLFVPLSLADELVLRVSPAERPRVALRLEPPDPRLADAESNLAVRAARAFLEAAGLCLEIEIALTKRTPVAAGLGGGSSDAAAVLRGLSGSFPDGLGAADLARLALALGADVPFFLDARPCWVRGVGERLDPVAGLPRLALLLANPGVPLATAEVFRAFDALSPGWQREPAAPPDPQALADAARRRAVLPLWVENDLEPAARRLCPAVGRLRDRLSKLGALAVGMSGSGPTLYGVFEDDAAAREALGRAELGSGAWARVATTLEAG